MSDPRWTPVLRGDVYCSPGCGFKCKKADYDHAVANADELARKLGAPWVPRVHENGCWHWGATIPGKEFVAWVSGPSRYHPRDKYWVSITADGVGQMHGNYDDPVEGVRDCLARAEAVARAALADVAALKGGAA